MFKIYCIPVSIENVENEIKSVCSDSLTGDDNISMQLIKPIISYCGAISKYVKQFYQKGEILN